jgi:hypothetical protein
MNPPYPRGIVDKQVMIDHVQNEHGTWFHPISFLVSPSLKLYANAEGTVFEEFHYKEKKHEVPSNQNS